MDAAAILTQYLIEHSPLSEAERIEVIKMACVQFFTKGTMLLKEGQYSKDDYFILKGCLRAYYLIDGIEKTIEFYTEHEPVSPICVTEQTTSAYYLTCMEDSVLLISNQELEQNSFEQLPILERMCRLMSEQLLAKKQVDLHSFKTQSPEQRYMNLLANRPDLIQRVPQYQLASYLGITPQSLSRIRNRLVKK